MPANVNDLTRDNVAFDSSKPATGNSHVDLLISGKAVLEQVPGQSAPTAHRPRT